jgi:hypothetical protein
MLKYAAELRTLLCNASLYTLLSLDDAALFIINRARTLPTFCAHMLARLPLVDDPKRSYLIHHILGVDQVTRPACYVSLPELSSQFKSPSCITTLKTTAYMTTLINMVLEHKLGYGPSFEAWFIHSILGSYVDEEWSIRVSYIPPPWNLESILLDKNGLYRECLIDAFFIPKADFCFTAWHQSSFVIQASTSDGSITNMPLFDTLLFGNHPHAAAELLKHVGARISYYIDTYSHDALCRDPTLFVDIQSCVKLFQEAYEHMHIVSKHEPSHDGDVQ